MSVFSVSVRPDLQSYQELCEIGNYSMLELNEALRRAVEARNTESYQKGKARALKDAKVKA